MEEKKKKEESKEVFEVSRDGKKIKKVIRGRFFEDFEVGDTITTGAELLQKAITFYFQL